MWKKQRNNTVSAKAYHYCCYLFRFQLFQAVYAFQARGPLEISLSEGQPVRVVQQHDLEGNTEWWLVEIEGKQGYAPANYLYQMRQW